MSGDLRVRVDVLQVPTEGFTLKLLPQSRARCDVAIVHFGHTWTQIHDIDMKVDNYSARLHSNRPVFAKRLLN